MKRVKTLQVTVTEDEMRDLISKIRTKEDEDRCQYSISSFIREFCIRPVLNGDSSPPQETNIEPSTENRDGWDDINF